LVIYPIKKQYHGADTDHVKVVTSQDQIV